MIVDIKCMKQYKALTVSINDYSNKLELFDVLEYIKSIYGREYLPKEQIWLISIPNIKSLLNKLEKAGIRYCLHKKARKEIEKYELWINKQNHIKKHYRINIGEVLTKELRPYQTVGASFILSGKKAILADSVGLGKTIQALAATEILINKKKIEKSLIICPSTLKKKWGKEIENFTNREFIIIEGTRPNRSKQYTKALNSNKVKYIITSYDLLRHDSFTVNHKGMEEFEIIKNNISKYSLIFDEIQYIKNGSAKRTIVSKEIINKVKYCFGLSATYIELGLEDLFWIFNSLDISLFGNKFWLFADKHINYNSWTGRIESYKNTKPIKQKIKPYVIRRFKEEVLDQLPDRIEKTYWVNLSKEQRQIYEEIKHNISKSLYSIERIEKVNRASILTNMNYLRQVCLSTELMGTKEHHSTKLNELKRIILEDIPKAKIVIFCHYKKMIEILYRELSSIGLNCIYMHGDYPKKQDERWKLIQEFENREDLDALITSDILSEGHDLQFANILINYDLLWNPAKIEQRNGRIDRIGQKHNSIIIINVVSSDTIEEYMWEKLEERKKIIKDIVDDNFISSRLDLQTIKEIVNG